MSSVVIPDSVTEIEDWAFAFCENLTNVTIPEGVKVIGDHAFCKCTNLTSIVIPASVTKIGKEVFAGCLGLTRVVISEGVTEIGDYFLDYYTQFDSNGATMYEPIAGLTCIVIPASVTKISGYAFRGCTSLTSIVVDADNKVYDSRENCNAIIETETNLLIKGCNKTIIPKSVTKIGCYAFSGCTDLTSVVIPEGVTEIEYHAFHRCI